MAKLKITSSKKGRKSVHPPTKRPANTRQKALPSEGNKRRRYRPGTKALKEIRYFQRTSTLLLRKLPFARLVKEMQMQFSRVAYRWQANALLALQEAAESHLVKLFEDA